MAGVTIQTIQRIESGESDPRLATKRRIAEALGWVPESYDNPIEPDHPELSTRIEQIETRLDALESRSALTDNQELSPSQQALLAAFIRSL